jgi:penicillin-binding protein 1C
MNQPSPNRLRRVKHIRVRHWFEIIALTTFAILLFTVGGAIVWASLIPIPSIADLENRSVSQSTKIYDRTGNIVLYDVHGAEQRTSVPLTAISPYIQQGTIAIEDATFYENAGFRPLSFARALWIDLTSGGFVQGGSTITQQVVKNALLTQGKTVGRKVQEIILALRLTKAYSKDEILNTYLNESPYGGTVYGVEAAAQYFFGVAAKDVDLAQAAYISALPQSPTRLSPYGSHRDELDGRKNLVLSRMKELGFITSDAYQQAIAEKVVFRSQKEGGVKAPHFVFYIREYLEKKYGVDAVENGGLRVTTTLDYDLQQNIERIVTKNAPAMQKEFNASNTALVAIDPKTGQILGMLGSKDYFNNAIDGQVNVAVANRQPGSSFKPFVYAAAFEKGYTPETMVFDLQTQFSTVCRPDDVTNDTPPCYSPGNYDGTFKGPMSLRNALAMSENIPAVKTLYLAGIDNAIRLARSLGITTLVDSARYGLTLVLGGGEVTLLDMTGAYGVFANDGVKNPPTGILSVSDKTGTVLEQYQSQATRVIDPQIARTVSDVLSDNVARTPEFGADSPLNFKGYDVADKTGTTNDSRDAWIIGYTPSIVIGEWAGNNNNTPMVKKIAAFIVAPTWHEVMLYALKKYSSPTDAVALPAPNPNADSLPPVLKGSWNTNPAQGVHDILYWVQRNNPTLGAPTNPASDSQFAYWDYPVSLWAQNASGTFSSGYTPSEFAGALGGGGKTGGFKIISPVNGSFMSSGSPIVINTSSPNVGAIANVTFYLNGQTLGVSHGAPHSLSFVPSSRGPVMLQAVANHLDGTTEVQVVNFNIQ